MSLSLFVLAALLFAVGGLCMKYSDGLTRLQPSVAVFLCFLSGAVCQAIGMRRHEMGTAYTLVLGLEAVAAVALSYFVLGERVNAGKVGAMSLIVAGMIWLERA